MIKSTQFLLVIEVLILAVPFRASAGGCGTVVVDCKAQKISFDGMPSSSRCGPVDHITCGPRTTYNSTPGEPGKIGGLHSGRKVTYGVEIMGIDGMGNSGGGKVFHMTSTSRVNSCPLKNNYGQGCITTTPEVLQKLFQCQGSSLVITGAMPALNVAKQKSPPATNKSMSSVESAAPTQQYTPNNQYVPPNHYYQQTAEILDALTTI